MKNLRLMLVLLAGAATSGSIFAESYFVLDRISNDTGQDLRLYVQGDDKPHIILSNHTVNDQVDIALKAVNHLKQINSQDIFIGTDDKTKMFTLKVDSVKKGTDRVDNRVTILKLNGASYVPVYDKELEELTGVEVNKDFLYKIQLRFITAGGEITIDDDAKHTKVLRENRR